VTTVTQDQFKGAWHALLAGMFATTMAYNAMRLLETHHSRNLLNVGLYGSLSVWEWIQAVEHYHDARCAACEVSRRRIV
jgi:hypothetical protein